MTTKPKSTRPPRSFRAAVALSMAQKYFAFVLQLGMAMILARLLTPAETGIYSLAAATVALGHMLRDFGMSDFLITHKDASEERVRETYTVTILIAWSLALIIWLVAPPLGVFYKEAGVTHVLQVLCISFLLLPFGTTASAMMSRRMEFGTQFAIQTVVLIVSAVVTVVCAWLGMSYMSLAYGAVAANLCSIVLLTMVAPGAVFLRPRWSGLGDVLRFGGTLTVARSFEQVANRSSDFIVSGMLGFHATGLLSKASTLVSSFHEFFNSAVVRVATPAFSKAGHEAQDVSGSYMQATAVVAAALWIFFPIVGIFADEIVFVLFGEKWLECVPLIHIMAIGSMAYAPYLLSHSLLTARRAVAEQLRIQMISAPVMVAALLIGATHSLQAVIVASTLAGFFRLFLLERAMRAVTGITLWNVVGNLGTTALMSLGCMAAGVTVKYVAAGFAWPVLIELPVGVAAMLLAAALGSWVFKLSIAAEVQRFLRSRAERKSAQRSLAG